MTLKPGKHIQPISTNNIPTKLCKQQQIASGDKFLSKPNVSDNYMYLMLESYQFKFVPLIGQYVGSK